MIGSMVMMPGTRLGHYEIVSPLGAGGMGEVFRARDTKLDRDVAIKVLPFELAQDRERLARFEREAKLLIMAAAIHTRVALDAEPPEVVVDGGWPLSSGEFAALPNGRLLMVKSEPEAVPTRLNVIFNWFDLLKAKVPLK